MNSRGLELPIRTAIILIILTILALLILAFFTQQLDTQSTAITEKEQKLAFTLQKNRMENKCKELCATAEKTETLKDQAYYCIQKFEEKLDLTKDFPPTDYDETLLVGIGLCEDKTYCPHLTHCTIKNNYLNMQKCKEILCEYLKEQGLTDPKINEALAQYFEPGKCYEKPQNQPNHWFTRLFDKNNNKKIEPNEINC